MREKWKANWTQVQENRTLTQKFHTRNYMASYYKYAKIYLEIHVYIKCKTLNIFKPNWDISFHEELFFIKCSICKMCSKTKIHQNKHLSVHMLKGVRFIWPLWLLFKIYSSKILYDSTAINWTVLITKWIKLGHSEDLKSLYMPQQWKKMGLWIWWKTREWHERYWKRGRGREM